MASPRNKVSRKLAPVLRKLQDRNLDVLGTPTQILRISTVPQPAIEIDGQVIDGLTTDVFGYSDTTYVSQVFSNAYLNYPFNEVELFESRDETEVSGIISINMAEILPIELKIKYKGDNLEDPVNIEQGDLIIDVLEDEKGNKLPVIMEVEKLLGGALDKYIVTKKYELSVYKGELKDEFQAKIDEYVNNL